MSCSSPAISGSGSFNSHSLGNRSETAAVGRWLADRVAEGVPPHDIGVFVRANGQLRRARAAVKKSGTAAVELSDKIETAQGRISIGTMHLAKGLEFRAVAVMACDDEVIRCRSASRT
jgi:superfamily I DNA/RNA helicase